MQFESNAIIQHDPILEYNSGIKVDPQASPHFYTFPSSIKQAFVDLKLQSKALYTSKILVCLLISFRAESCPEGIKEISHFTLLQQQQIDGKNINFKLQVEYVHCLLTCLTDQISIKIVAHGSKNLNLTNLINGAVFDAGLRICTSHACSAGFGLKVL